MYFPGYLLDPHTAVARTVSERFDAESCPMLVSGTAHYNKFAPDVLDALGHTFYSEKKK